MFFIDPMYLIIVGPTILLAIWAQSKVKSAYAEGSKYRASSGMSGAETAERILMVYGIHNVSIEPVKTFLGDHYDPKSKTLRLSPDVYHGRSLASLGIAAHEVGHAIQDKVEYSPLVIRNGIVPLASVGTHLSFLLIIGGLILSMMTRASDGSSLGMWLATAGVGLFGTVVLFQLVNLPVEFNASSRAREILVSQGMITTQEDQIVAKVLNAAAMTYVAATITAIAQFAYYAFLVFGRRD